MKRICSLVLGVTTAFSAVSADQKSPALTDKAHPSISAQVRLSSWWIARHAENIAAVEAANDPKKDQKIELFMVGDSITHNFDKDGPGEAGGVESPSIDFQFFHLSSQAFTRQQLSSLS